MSENVLIAWCQRWKLELKPNLDSIWVKMEIMWNKLKQKEKARVAFQGFYGKKRLEKSDGNQQL